MVAILTSLLCCHTGQACLTQLSDTHFPAKSTMESPFPPFLGSSCSPGSDPPDLVPIGLDEPEGAIRACRDSGRAAIGGRKGELADRPTGRDAPDHSIVLGEPEVAIGAHRDISRAAIGSRNGEFGDRAGAIGRDAPDLVPKVLGEPEVAIWTFRDGLNVASYSRSKLGDLPLGRDPSDLAHIGLDEPEVAIRTRRDGLGTAVECLDRELGERPTGRDPPDTPLRRLPCQISEPEIAIRASRDAIKDAIRNGE